MPTTSPFITAVPVMIGYTVGALVAL